MSSSTTNPDRPELPPIPDACNWDHFREDAYKTIDLIVDYNKALLNRDITVHRDIQPGYLTGALGGNAAALSPPEHPQRWDETLRQIKAGVLPGMLHWQHPDFLAYFPAQMSPPALLGDLIASAMNQPGFSWACSPASTEMELLVMDWSVEAFGLDRTIFSFKHGTGGACIKSTATEAAIISILAAKASYLRVNKASPELVPKMVVYISDQAHFCVEKASKEVGIGQLRKIPTVKCDVPFRGNRSMCLQSFKNQVEEDIAAGFIPLFVSANFGATGMCAVDDIAGIDKIAKEHNIWLNIDAAYAGVVSMLPEMRSLTTSFSLADSIFINGSKWMNCLLNSTLFYFRDRSAIAASLNATGVYLENNATSAGVVVDLKDYQVGLGSPFRSLKFFTMFQAFGIEGMRSSLRRHILLAKYLVQALETRSSEFSAAHGTAAMPFIFPVEPIFGLVCAAFNPACYPKHKYADFRKFIDMINGTDKIYIVHTVLTPPLGDAAAAEQGDLFVLRFSLASTHLEFADMDRIVEVVFDQLLEFNKIEC